jgi:hypothetical protein
MAAFNSWLAPMTKLIRAVRERGWKGTVIQLYTVRILFIYFVVNK